MPDSAFQDILVDACAVTKAGVGMAGGVGRIGGKLPGKLRFALTIFVVRIRLDADFLKAMRTLAGLSQSELAGQADVPVRTIQQYEQRQKDINKAQAETLLRLARALNCNVEDLMEKVPPLNFK